MLQQTERGGGTEIITTAGLCLRIHLNCKSLHSFSYSCLYSSFIFLDLNWGQKSVPLIKTKGVPSWICSLSPNQYLYIVDAIRQLLRISVKVLEQSPPPAPPATPPAQLSVEEPQQSTYCHTIYCICDSNLIMKFEHDASVWVSYQ